MERWDPVAIARNQRNFALSHAVWELGWLLAEDAPAIMADMVEAGHDSAATVTAAGLIRPTRRDNGTELDAGFTSVDGPLSRQESWDRIADSLAIEIVSRNDEGLRQLCKQLDRMWHKLHDSNNFLVEAMSAAEYFCDPYGGVGEKALPALRKLAEERSLERRLSSDGT